MGLRALGVEKGDRVAILSENRPEWAYRRPGHAVRGARWTCPSTRRLTPPQVLYILNDSEAKVLFVSNAAAGAARWPRSAARRRACST